jgi:hypothetical protein
MPQGERKRVARSTEALRKALRMVRLSLWQQGGELFRDRLDDVVRLECGHGHRLLLIGKLGQLPR